MIILKPAARYPADPRAVFVLALSVFSGITALVLEAAPDSLESQIPHWAVVIWGVLLTLGSVLALAGMARQTVWGIIVEQVGCVTIAATTIFYTGVAILDTDQESSQLLGLVLGWGLACGVRYIQLQFLLRNAEARAQKRILLDRLDADLRERLERRSIRGDEHPEHLTRWGV